MAPKKTVTEKIARSVKNKPSKVGLSDEQIKEVHAMAAMGLKPGEVMGCLGRSPTSAGAMMNQSVDFREAYTQGQSLGVRQIANKLFTAASNGNVTAMIFWLKAVAGWTDEPQQQINHNNTHTLNIFTPEILTPDKWIEMTKQQSVLREEKRNAEIAALENVKAGDFSEVELAEMAVMIEDVEET